MDLLGCRWEEVSTNWADPSVAHLPARRSMQPPVSYWLFGARWGVQLYCTICEHSFMPTVFLLQRLQWKLSVADLQASCVLTCTCCIPVTVCVCINNRKLRRNKIWYRGHFDIYNISSVCHIQRLGNDVLNAFLKFVSWGRDMVQRCCL